MQNGIRGSANARQHTNRIFEGRPGQDLRHAEVFLDHFNRAPTRLARQDIAATVDRRDCGVAGESHAQRLNHTGHGAGSPHGHAVAMGPVHTALGVDEFFAGHTSPPNLFGHLPDARSRSDRLTAPASRQHRSARDSDGRKID